MRIFESTCSCFEDLGLKVHKHRLPYSDVYNSECKFRVFSHYCCHLRSESKFESLSPFIKHLRVISFDGSCNVLAYVSIQYRKE